MPKLSELVAGDDAGDTGGATKLSDLLASDTAGLKAQYGGPDETMGQAVKADTDGLAGLDFTNPSNMGNVIHHGVPMLLQMLGTVMGGQAGGRVGQVIGSGLGSGAGYLFQSAAEPMAKGLPPTTTAGGLAGNVLLGGGAEVATQGAGSMLRGIAGKGAALQEGEAAAQGALAKRADVMDAIKAEEIKHSETALQGVKEAEVERLVKEGLGPKTEIAQPVTIESLTAATRPPQQAARSAMQGVFDGISAKYQAALEPYGDVTIPDPTLRSSIKTIRSDLRDAGQTVSPKLGALLQEAEGGKPVNLSQGPRGRLNLSDINPKVLDKLTPDQIWALKGGQNAPGMMAQGPSTVNQQMGLRSRLLEVVRNSKDATDRRVAASAVDAIQGDIDKVLPPEMKPVMQNLADEWHQAKSTFSDSFRNRLWRASSPEQVAEAIYNGAKTGKQMGHRTELLMNQIQKEAPEQAPVLRQSFATMVANSADPVAEVQKMPPNVFKAMFPGTGFDKPENWVEALNGRVTMKTIAQSPELMAKYSSGLEAGMNSFGTRQKIAAMTKAQDILKSNGTSQQMIADALKSTEPPAQAFQGAAMEGMRKPMLGRFQTYMQHRMLFDTALALASGAGLLVHHPGAAALGLVYLGGSRAIGAALARPTVARLYYNMLTSKTAEQVGFWAGRTMAAGLGESVRSAKSD